MNKKIIILTKSAKYKNYCVAGIEYNTGEWIRLENKNAERGAITEKDMTYKDGSVCDVLDVVEVECIEESAVNYYQPENVYIDTGKKWEKIGQSSWQQVLEKHPAEVKQFILGSLYDSLTPEWAERNNCSLQLVKVQNLIIETSIIDENGKTKHPKATFDYINSKGESIKYRLTVTDLDYYPMPQQCNIGEAYLITSLGVPFASGEGTREYHYILIAKIIEIKHFFVTKSNKTGKCYYHEDDECKLLKRIGWSCQCTRGEIIKNGIEPCKECFL